MSTKQIATSTLWQFASQIVMAALSIATVKMVAVGLSQELAGNYNSAYGYLQIFGILADFGLYAVAIREISKASNRRAMVGAFLVLRTIILVISLGSALLFAWIFPAWRGTPLPLGITIAAFVPCFTLLAGVLRSVFQANYKMHFVFIAEVTQRVVTVALMAILLFMGTRASTDIHDYRRFLLAGVIGAFMLLLLSLVFASRFEVIRPNFDRMLLGKLFRLSLPFGIAFLCTAFYRQSDITLIALLRPDYEIQNAYYGFVQRTLDMGYLLPTFLLNSTLPILSERHAKGQDTKSLLGKILFLILLLSTTMFLFAFLWPRPIMQLLTTEEYLSAPSHPGSDTALRLLSFSMLLNGLVLYPFYVLLAHHRWRSLVTVLALGALFSIVLNSILIPDLGFRGAAITSIATHVFLASILLPVGLWTLPVTFGMRMFLHWIIFSALVALALFLLAPFLASSAMTIVGFFVMGFLITALSFGMGLHRIVW